MNASSRRIASLLGSACLAAAFHAPSAFAQSGPPLDRESAEERGPHGPRSPGRAPHPLLDGVELSEAQQDRLFAIMHDAAPKRREYDKAQRKAMDSLRAAASGDKFDEAKAAAAAQALGQAIATEELLRARTDAQVMALLTPQQREGSRNDRGPRR